MSLLHSTNNSCSASVVQGSFFTAGIWSQVGPETADVVLDNEEALGFSNAPNASAPDCGGTHSVHCLLSVYCFAASAGDSTSMLSLDSACDRLAPVVPMCVSV